MMTLVLVALGAAPLFGEPSKAALDVRQTGVRHEGELTVRDVVFRGEGERELKATVVTPPGAGPFAAVLFVHWLGEPNCDRTEFLAEAQGLAKRGVVSLLIDAPWAEKDWFDHRTCDGDHQDSLRQVAELRRALDVLLQQPGVDPKRVGYVGHDFGAMYGALLASVDTRPKAWVLMAGTSHFADWFLLGAPPKDKDAYVKRISALDPVHFIGKATGSVLFQFAEKDKYVPLEKAREFFEAAKQPKLMRTYPVDHQLNSKDGLNERTRWLAKELGLTL